MPIQIIFSIAFISAKGYTFERFGDSQRNRALKEIMLHPTDGSVKERL
jgi:hypothetical protein